MAASEQVQLLVNKVRHKKRDGTLFLMGERIAWCPDGRDQFDVSILYADIKCQKVSPEGKTKVQLQIITLKGDSYVFQFFSTSSAKPDRENVKNLLAKMLPLFRRKIDKELEEKNRLLQVDPELFQTYKDLVVSGVITPEEFWTSHSSKLSSECKLATAQKVGVSTAFLADVRPQADGCNGLRYNLTSDTIQSIFATYPAVRSKYLEKVPDTLSEKEFWTMFFQSHYFHRDRVSQGNNSKDLFSDCVKKDEQDIRTILNIGVKDVFNDLNYLDDEDSTKAEGYGSVAETNRGAAGRGKPSNTHVMHRNIIKRFNHQSAMILTSASKHEVERCANGDGPETSAADHATATKKMKLKEANFYDDLEGDSGGNKTSLNLHRSERYSHGPTVLDHTHQELDSSSVREGMSVVSSQCLNYKPRLSHALTASDAASALTLLTSSAGSDVSSQSQSISRLLTPAQHDQLRQLYLSSSELLRHFWSCFPANTPFLQEKAVRMCKSVENFHQSRVHAFQDQLRRSRVSPNVTDHLEEMLNAAYVKFEAWQMKKSARK